MKPSERILVCCAVVVTFVAITIWLKLFELQPRPPQPRRKIDVNTGRHCVTPHSGRPLLTEDVTVNSNSTLRNALVFLDVG